MEIHIVIFSPASAGK